MVKVSISRHEPIFSIGHAAERIGVSIASLRMYEQKGLVLPFRGPSGRRSYSIHDLELILCVREMIVREGLNIEGIRRLMGLMPCWKWKKCLPEEREQCPGYTVQTAPCWSLAETPCRQVGEDCRDCRVYRELPSCKSLRGLMRK